MDDNNKKTETVSIVGFILSFFVPIVGLILSIIGINKGKKNNSSTGLAIAGLIISILVILIRLFVLVLLFIMLGLSTGVKGIAGKYDQFCENAQYCEHLFGDYYNCSYDKGGIHIKSRCRKDKINEDVIKVDTDALIEAAEKYYINIYDGVITEHATIEELSDTYIIRVSGIKLFIDKETLQGVDSHSYKVDLNTYLEETNA